MYWFTQRKSILGYTCCREEKRNEGTEIPERLWPEPDNPVDSNAIIAFVCQVVPDQWEQIGYVVKEVCDDVH